MPILVVEVREGDAGLVGPTRICMVQSLLRLLTQFPVWRTQTRRNLDSVQIYLSASEACRASSDAKPQCTDSVAEPSSTPLSDSSFGRRFRFSRSWINQPVGLMRGCPPMSRQNRSIPSKWCRPAVSTRWRFSFEFLFEPKTSKQRLPPFSPPADLLPARTRPSKRCTHPPVSRMARLGALRGFFTAFQKGESPHSKREGRSTAWRYSLFAEHRKHLASRTCCLVCD